MRRDANFRVFMKIGNKKELEACENKKFERLQNEKSLTKFQIKKSCHRNRGSPSCDTFNIPASLQVYSDFSVARLKLCGCGKTACPFFGSESFFF